ncbi:MAG: Ig-like domain-containing protein, partial [Acidobacteriota bacterium]|nr:Ig-like domain-containing protein [Acidobacteriota bacterium]
MITATKSATLGTDVNGNGFVNPGDTLMYSVVVSNSAAPGAGNDALNVIFTDQLNGDLTLVGTATASPIATNDAYDVLGNVRIQVPVGSGLLANDVNPQGTGTISVTGAPTTSAQGGNVAVNADGSFSYNPPPGYTGPDSFTYTITHNPNGKMDTGTVTFTVSGMIWFIDNNAAACTTLAAGCGRLTNPFSSVAAFQALNNGTGNNPAVGDNIFVYRLAGANYTGPLTLLNNQKLGGQGMTVTLASFTGLTPPLHSDALPATSGTRPVIRVSNNAGGNNLTLGQGNTLRGFNLEANSSGANTTGAALIGNGFGSLTASEISITSDAGMAGNCGAAVNLNNGNPTATFTSVSANRCTNGMVLTNLTGPVTVAGTGSAGSGGTIQNILNNDGVVLNTTSGLISLNYMIIQDITATNDATDALQTHSGADAIHGRTVSGGLVLTNSTIQRISDNAINGTVDASPVTGNPTNTTWSGLTLTNN